MVQIESEHITKPCGFDCAWSNPTFSNSNRHCDEVGAALVAHSDLKQTTILAKSPEVTLLVESKRWVERAYTAENGLLFFVTCVYGYSGAKKCPHLYKQNELLYQAAVIHASTRGAHPHFLCTDANVDPNESLTMKMMVASGKWSDLFAPRFKRT
jgi:hypothetical protein